MKFEFQSIGTFHTQKKNKYDAARQAAVDSVTEIAYIELNDKNNFEQALLELDQFSHLWVIYVFHKNPNWNPMVQPPRGTDKKVGVFSSRSPHRPNPIGISCLEIDRIEGRKIYVKNHDLLDESPILDLKPYLSYADSFPEASLGWLKLQPYEISFSEYAQVQLRWLEEHGLQQLRGFILNQLEYDPTNHHKKRVKPTEDKYELAYRTWRILFLMNDKCIQIEKIYSGYTSNELSQQDDKYLDKELHRKFTENF